MGTLLISTLLDSISSFNSLSSSNTVKGEMVRRYCQKIDEILRLLKPVLEVISDITSDVKLNKVLEELDAVVNEARELVEGWHHMMSKAYFVLQIESVILKIRASVLDTCRILNSVFLSPVDNATSACIEHCIEKIQHMQYEQTSDVIKEGIKDQVEKRAPRAEYVKKISDSLSLSSNQELLMEAVALEKLKAQISRGENHEEVEHIDHMISLVTHMHDCHIRAKQLHSINGVPIPPDFCCPLSLELMSDPVIVASGQTYERAFIKKWLDQGLTVCPKTRQTLGHTNLIPNYTVKALIANWCESNDIKLPDPIKSMNLNLPPMFLNHSDSSANDTNIPHSGHSPRMNHPRSPESNRSKITSYMNTVSSNGSLQENYQQEKPASPHHPLSIGSSLHAVNGSGVNHAKMSLESSEGKNKSLSEGRNGETSGQNSNPTSQEFSHSSLSGEQFLSHRHSVSASSGISGNDNLQAAGDANLISRVSSDLSNCSSDASGEVAEQAPASSTSQRVAELPQRSADPWSRNQTIWRRPSEMIVPRIVSSPSVDSRPDLSGVETQVRKLIEDLRSESLDVQRDATAELRLLAKHNMENRIVIANCGAISQLVGLLNSTDQKTQEHAVTALLNLSINDNNKSAIANADAIEPLIYVLEHGSSEAKENAAATLFSLSVIEENKVKIGRSGAIKPLVELLGNGTPRGKKDAATALFNLSIFHENKARIVQVGAVRHLVELMDPAAGMVDKAVAVLANLATIQEGRNAIGHEGGIPALVDIVELGSARGKENAAAALLQLCTNSNRFCSLVLQEGAVPPLVALSQSGTPRAKEKAQALLSHFRNQRHGNAARP